MGTIEFLDRVKAVHSIPSDYALGPFLGLTKSQVSAYRMGKSHLGDSTAVRVAELLDLDPAYVLACIHAERTTDDTLRAVWLRAADKMSGATHVAVLGVLAFLASLFIGGGPDGAAMAKVPDASPAAVQGDRLCVMSTIGCAPTEHLQPAASMPSVTCFTMLALHRSASLSSASSSG